MFVQWILLICSAALISSKGLPERIVGGQSVSILSVPWQASLQKFGGHHCGAVIYSEKIVLTAAHCTERKPPYMFSVRVGSSISGFGGQVVKVSQILEHESFGRGFAESNDIAVIQLQSNLIMGFGVSSIPLADSSPQPRSLAFVSGWGSIESYGKGSTTLLGTTVAIVDRDSCMSSYRGRISKDMICASAPGKDSCRGDSGGPLVFDGKLVGIVSFGMGCALSEYPGVYANVAELKPWIVKTIKRL
ncbi:trypsin delta-like [Drosophila eugracilis]|uniref:trypsin delta-like n=1 Tax=Drosophila eugracilis TaxID=29029 RepID=UPI0007E7B9A7|nr:trypsin delta-like [Drosophila eugracilis]